MCQEFLNGSAGQFFLGVSPMQFAGTEHLGLQSSECSSGLDVQVKDGSFTGLVVMLLSAGSSGGAVDWSL